MALHLLGPETAFRAKFHLLLSSIDGHFPLSSGGTLPIHHARLFKPAHVGS